VGRPIARIDRRQSKGGETVAQTVLIVEDDADVVRVARAYLERDGFEVAVESDGESGLRRALADPPALVVLDWMLPRMSGLEVLRELRRERSTPVILLTARTDELDRVIGLEVGADDYVVKPFSPRELVARVRAVLRRSEGAIAERSDEVVEHGGLRLDVTRRLASVGGQELSLTTLEFDLLHALARAPGRVFGREDLIERVWGPDFDGVDRVVDVHVSNLRQKLAAVGAEGLLRTVRGVGYALG
jgi:DNA-binding response OmpR family regulator